MLLCLKVQGQSDYPLQIRGVDKDSAFIVNQLGVATSFPTRYACIEFINKLPAQLMSKGYVTASVDSVQFDSTFARVVLFVGEVYRWASIDTRGVDRQLLDAAGWREKTFDGKPMDFKQVAELQDRILDYLENNGHPFAKISLDSMRMENEQVTAQLKVDKGPTYKVDSIRVYGDVKISNLYLQRYLDIPNGSSYNKAKLLPVKANRFT